MEQVCFSCAIARAVETGCELKIETPWDWIKLAQDSQTSLLRRVSVARNLYLSRVVEKMSNLQHLVLEGNNFLECDADYDVAWRHFIEQGFIEQVPREMFQTAEAYRNDWFRNLEIKKGGSKPMNNILKCQISSRSLTDYIDMRMDGIRRLSSLPHLTTLTLGEIKDCLGFSIDDFSSLPYLTTLKFQRFVSLDANDAQSLSAFRKLSKLVFKGWNNLDAEDARHLSFLQELVHLKIGSGNKLGAEGARHLSSLKNLTKLTIGSGNDLGMEGARHLSFLEGLIELTIGNENRIGAEGARYLSALQKLTTLTIGSGNDLGTESVHCLSELRNLSLITIGEIRLEKEEEENTPSSSLPNVSSSRAASGLTTSGFTASANSANSADSTNSMMVVECNHLDEKLCRHVFSSTIKNYFQR